MTRLTLLGGTYIILSMVINHVSKSWDDPPSTSQKFTIPIRDLLDLEKLPDPYWVKPRVCPWTCSIPFWDAGSSSKHHFFRGKNCWRTLHFRWCVTSSHQSWKTITRWGGGFKDFLFLPRSLGKWSHLTNIFRRGWNHQLDNLCMNNLCLKEKIWDIQWWDGWDFKHFKHFLASFFRVWGSFLKFPRIEATRPLRKAQQTLEFYGDYMS